MIRRLGLGLALILAASAQAQTAAPPAPTPAAVPAPRPVVPAAPAAAGPVNALPPDATASAKKSPATSATPAAPVVPLARTRSNIAVLQALDKVTARVNRLTGKVGETLRFGTLAIVVRACVARPADLAPDSAAFLEVTDGAATAPLFRAWMFAAEPALAVLEHPVYDLRVTACTP